MARYHFKMQRLFVNHPLLADENVQLDKTQSNYLINVLRMKEGSEILVFNGKQGEWLAKLDNASKKNTILNLVEQTRLQPMPASLDYCFAPLKHARLDYMVQKAVEMGVGRLRPVLTAYCQVSRINLQRMRANAIEAAEQCGILSIPEVLEPIKLSSMIDNWPKTEPDRCLIFCDEGDERLDSLSILERIETKQCALLIGPEGGFSDEERTLLLHQDFVNGLPLGPRILRADTAAVAALALVQAKLGDWK